MSEIINASEWQDRKRLAEARRLQHLIGQDDFTDAEIVGGAFCDGLMNGVSAMAMHEAYMQSNGAMDFEARVWAEIEKVRK